MKLLDDIKQFPNWQNVLSVAIDRVLVILSLCMIPAVASSLARIPVSGYQISMLLHVVLAIILILASFYRKKLSIKFKLYLLLTFSAAVSLFGLYNWGLLGNGFLWSMMVIMFATLCFGTKTGIYWSAVVLLYAVGVSLIYIFDLRSAEVDPHVYVHSFSGWATAIFGSALPLIVTVIIVGSLFETAKKVIYKLEKQRIQITVLAERDSLTGLYNARMFHEFISQSLERSRRHNTWLYLFNMDLNGFKKINDKYGHHAGDLILQHVSQRMLDVTRAEDTLCRVGGDEFLMLSDYPKQPDPEQVQQLILRLKKACSTPITYEGKELSVTISVGFAAYNASKTPKLKNQDDILKLADRAMYKDKKESRAQQAS